MDGGFGRRVDGCGARLQNGVRTVCSLYATEGEAFGR
jgi:hypothetical protein